MNAIHQIASTAGRAIVLLAVFWLGGAAADPAADYDRGAKAYREGDVVTAMQHLERAASASHPEAQYLLGYILDKAGENEAAVGHYESAFDNGNADAAIELAVMYTSGDGVEKSLETALSWYEKAAAAGSSRAMVILARAYLDGRLGLAQDEARARELLGRAADNGSDSARLLLESLDQEAAKAN